MREVEGSVQKSRCECEGSTRREQAETLVASIVPIELTPVIDTLRSFLNKHLPGHFKISQKDFLPSNFNTKINADKYSTIYFKSHC